MGYTVFVLSGAGAGIRRCGDRLFVYRFDLVAVVRGAIGQGVYAHSVVWVKSNVPVC